MSSPKNLITVEFESTRQVEDLLRNERVAAMRFHEAHLQIERVFRAHQITAETGAHGVWFKPKTAARSGANSYIGMRDHIGGWLLSYVHVDSTEPRSDTSVARFDFRHYDVEPDTVAARIMQSHTSNREPLCKLDLGELQTSPLPLLGVLLPVMSDARMLRTVQHDTVAQRIAATTLPRQAQHDIITLAQPSHV